MPREYLESPGLLPSAFLLAAMVACLFIGWWLKGEPEPPDDEAEVEEDGWPCALALDAEGGRRAA